MYSYLAFTLKFNKVRYIH